jgi:hypothetical protein
MGKALCFEVAVCYWNQDSNLYAEDILTPVGTGQLKTSPLDLQNNDTVQWLTIIIPLRGAQVSDPAMRNGSRFSWFPSVLQDKRSDIAQNGTSLILSKGT